MSSIKLISRLEAEETSVSNYFIDEIMPKANGEFVKVYLYLLRLAQDPLAQPDTEQMADQLMCTEKDILRALKYWAKEGLISLETGADKKPASVSLLPLKGGGEIPPALTAPAASGAPVPSADASSASKQAAGGSAARHGRLTPDRARELRGDEKITQLLYIAEQYLGKILTSNETDRILYFYDELGMSPELIEFLIEYCVEHGHKSIRYIETVALSWNKDGITTVTQARDNASMYNREFYDILKALGIRSRAPVEEEIAYMNRWLREYGFDLPIIQEACGRTVLSLGQPSFPYAEGILADWHRQKLHTMDDIRAADAAHEKARKNREPSRAAASAPANRFNNFHQREYDYGAFEKRILQKQSADKQTS